MTAADELRASPFTLALSGDTLRARLRDEWLLADGLGGFASGTVAGIPERRYHAWLIAATKPPVGRMATLMGCVEWLVVKTAQGVKHVELSTYRFTGDHVHPRGVDRLVGFEHGASCRWTYRVDEPALGLACTLTRELALVRHAGAAVVRYAISGSVPEGCVLEVRPLVANRDFHATNEDEDDAKFVVSAPAPGPGVRIASPGVALDLRLRDATMGRFVRDEQWWHNFQYLRDAQRGQDAPESLFSPGEFVLPVPTRGGVIGELAACADHGEGAQASEGCDEVVAREVRRREGLVAEALALAGSPVAPLTRGHLAALTLAGDQFVVRRNMMRAGQPARAASIIAGYPWFSDWGRDTCIALPGLLLATGRFEEARESLSAFAALRRRGLVPNCFENESGEPTYNTADASLWFVVACCKYLKATNDRAAFDALLRPACLDIIAAYRDGTDFSIRVDPDDGLVRAGDASTQLTWMDAKRDGTVFTPRFGKPVELSALWYAGLLMLSHALEATHPNRARECAQLADRAGRSFAMKFWNDQRQCLVDALVPLGKAWSPDPSMRPNQIFAVSLPYSPLPPTQQLCVVDAVTQELLTPYGLRTLARGEKGYCLRFEGPLFERDRAYHNGTAWAWLLGPYAEALMRVDNFSRVSRERAMACVTPLLQDLTSVAPRAGVSVPIEQLAEVFDAEALQDKPQRPEGCFAQAWSVAEVMRVLLMAHLGPASAARGL